MAGVNDFLTFAINGAPNVISQAAYSALAARSEGFEEGTANSAELNKVWRQSAFWAAALGKIIVDRQPTLDALDNGNLTTIVNNFLAAVYTNPALTGTASAPTVATGDNSTAIATSALIVNKLASYYTATQVAANFATIAQVNNAQNTANAANQAASTALVNSQNAQNTANNAQNTANTALNTFASYLPNPQGSNAGQRGYMYFAQNNFTATFLPPGGTWFYYVIFFNGGGNATSSGGGFAPGGSQINNGTATSMIWAIRVV